MRANVQRPFPHQAGKISTPAHFRGKLRSPSGQPARQLNLTASAQGRSGENFAARQTASVPTAPTASAQGHFRGNFTGMSDCPPVSPTQSHPHRGVPGKTSQGRKSRSVRQGNSPSVNRPHRIRAGLLREKLHKPKNHGAADGLKATPHQTAQRSPPVQPFWSNFAARQTAQRSFIRPSAPAKLLTHESARPTLARPNRNAPHAAPSDSATMSSA